MLIKKLIGSFLFILFFVCSIGAQSLETKQEIIKPTPKQERATTTGPTKAGEYQKGSATHKSTANKPTTIGEEPKPKVENNTTKSRHDYETENLKVQRQLSKSTEVIATFTKVLAIVGGFQIIVFLIQVFLLKGTLNATQVAADAAKKSADALPAMERAYIFVEIRFKEPFKEPVLDQNFCEMVITNYGKTPAILTYIEGFANVFGDYIPQKIEFERTGIMPYYEKIMGSRGEKIIDIDCITSLTKEKIDAVKEMARLICFGAIHYEDIFGKCHKTGFCWIYSTISHNFHFLDNPNNYRE